LAPQVKLFRQIMKKREKQRGIRRFYPMILKKSLEFFSGDFKKKALR